MGVNIFLYSSISVRGIRASISSKYFTPLRIFPVSNSGWFRKSSIVVMPCLINSLAFLGPMPYTFVNTLSGFFLSLSNTFKVPVLTYSFSLLNIVFPIRFTPFNSFGSLILSGYVIIASAASLYAFARKGSPCLIIISSNSDNTLINSSFNRVVGIDLGFGDVFKSDFLRSIFSFDLSLGDLDFNFSTNTNFFLGFFLTVFLELDFLEMVLATPNSLQYPYVFKVLVFSFIVVAHILPLPVSAHALYVCLLYLNGNIQGPSFTDLFFSSFPRLF